MLAHHEPMDETSGTAGNQRANYRFQMAKSAVFVPEYAASMTFVESHGALARHIAKFRFIRLNETAVMRAIAQTPK